MPKTSEFRPPEAHQFDSRRDAETRTVANHGGLVHPASPRLGTGHKSLSPKDLSSRSPPRRPRETPRPPTTDPYLFHNELRATIRYHPSRAPTRSATSGTRIGRSSQARRRTAPAVVVAQTQRMSPILIDRRPCCGVKWRPVAVRLSSEDAPWDGASPTADLPVSACGDRWMPGKVRYWGGRFT